MRLRYFLLGLVVGLVLAPASGHETWRTLRNRLAAALDAALRVGMR